MEKIGCSFTIVFIIVIGFSYIESYCREHKYKLVAGNLSTVTKQSLFFWSIAFIVLLFSFTRSEDFGADLYWYKVHFFQYVDERGTSYEALYEWLQFIFHQFSNSFRWFMMMCSSLTLIPVLITIREEVTHRYYWIALEIICLTFLLDSFSIVRAFLGLSFVFLAYKHIKIDENGKRHIHFRFYLYGFIAVCFHRTMLVNLLLLFISSFHLSFIKRVLIGLSFLGINSIIPNLISVIIKLTNDGRYLMYVDRGASEFSLSYFLQFFTIFFILNRYCRKNSKEEILSNYFFYMCLICFITVFPAQHRLLRQAVPLSAVGLPNIFEKIYDKRESFFVMLVYQAIIIFAFLLSRGVVIDLIAKFGG